MTILIAVGLVATSCAVGPQDAAVGINLTVEPGLADALVSEPVDTSDLLAMSIYLVRGEKLVHLTRDLPASGGPEAVINATTTGPTAAEARAGIWSAIPPATVVQNTRYDDGLIEIDLSSSFAAIGGPDETLAVAQIVLSVASLPDIDTVMFRIDGVAASIPRLDGVLVAQPVTFEHYRDLIDP